MLQKPAGASVTELFEVGVCVRPCARKVQAYLSACFVE